MSSFRNARPRWVSTVFSVTRRPGAAPARSVVRGRTPTPRARPAPGAPGYERRSSTLMAAGEIGHGIGLAVISSDVWSMNERGEVCYARLGYCAESLHLIKVLD